VAGAASFNEPQQGFAVLHRFELKVALSQHVRFSFQEQLRTSLSKTIR
jgi:hypothetical protein